MDRSTAVAELFANGSAIDCILGFMLLEVLAMIWWRRRSRSGLSLPEVLVSLAAGAALMLALRASLVGAPWNQMAFWLFVALLAHIADLALRFARAAHSAPRRSRLLS